MLKKRLDNQNEAGEPEELEDDSEFKELGDDDSEGAENPKNADEDDLDLEGETEEAEKDKAPEDI